MNGNSIESSEKGVDVISVKDVNITAAKAANVTAGTEANITAPVVNLAGGGNAVARQGDTVQVDIATGQGTITSGSGKVFSG
jgi:hypothetical protein